jgi:hypothetical protein
MSAAPDPAQIRRLMLDNIFVVFSERDRERRMKPITKNYTEDVTWSDPVGTTQGREAMNEQGQKLLDRVPNLLFSAGRTRLRRRQSGAASVPPWTARSAPAFSGIDVGLVRDGQLAHLYTMLTAENRPSSSEE